MTVYKILKAILLGLTLLAVAAPAAQAQMSKKQAKKLHKTLAKEAKKAIKEAEAKGYYEMPGALPLSTQMNESYRMQMQMDEEGYPKFIVGEAAAIGGTKIAAKNQAMEAAKLELAGKIESNIVALVEQSIANEQLTQEDAASITETVTASKNIISKKLGLVRPLVEAYRDVGKENVEALVRIAYDKEMAEQVSINTIKEELKKKSEDLHQKLDNLLNLSGN
jgi:hypothetical protein